MTALEPVQHALAPLVPVTSREPAPALMAALALVLPVALEVAVPEVVTAHPVAALAAAPQAQYLDAA